MRPLAQLVHLRRPRDPCQALARQAELEPRRTDPAHRARLRAEALEVVRNLHAAKVRLIEGDRTALASLFAILGPLLARTVAPTHLNPRPLVSAEVLTADPSRRFSARWPAPAMRTTRAQVGGSGRLRRGSAFPTATRRATKGP
ncbi:hypothetical protein ACFCYC_13965 [Streptomyces sp. NPDC056402]|uniref:hypothetical protein n=1 Tax=Streptomyces sp. NPDC056402 TaxID=3345810 RepID=UPI0035DE91C5